MPETTDALLESLSMNNTHSYQIFHPRVESFQQPPSVESQMRVSPNLFDNSPQNQPSPPKPSVLSMDLFNTIDFDKLSSSTPHRDVPQTSGVTQTFNRPRPSKKYEHKFIEKFCSKMNIHFIDNQHPLQQQQQEQTGNVKSRDDRQILARLAQQANKFNTSDKPPITRDTHPFRNLESALSSTTITTHQHLDRHGRPIRIPESEVRIST